MKILQLLYENDGRPPKSDIDPNETESVIGNSFKDRVIPDLLADEGHTGDIVDSKLIIQKIRKDFPDLSHLRMDVVDSADRVRIYFGQDGDGERIELPPKLRTELGDSLVMHEIAHLLYTKDLLCNKIVKHKNAPQAFTILRVLEDIAIERRLERDFPKAVDVFKTRGKHIMPAYKKHIPSDFAKQVDGLFLYLRGYSGTFKGDPYAIKYANMYLNHDNPNTKIKAVLDLVALFMHDSD